ncbi:hypothetical protein vseg_019534 [Gypsophila vaccaria]
MSKIFKDVDDTEVVDDHEKKKKKKKRVKKVVVSTFNKVYRRFDHKNTVKRGKFGWSLLCLSKPKTLDNSIDELCVNCNGDDDIIIIKGLIECNDFYSKECNAHFVE